jgi:hypothetical protein
VPPASSVAARSSDRNESGLEMARWIAGRHCQTDHETESVRKFDTLRGDRPKKTEITADRQYRKYIFFNIDQKKPISNFKKIEKKTYASNEFL